MTQADFLKKLIEDARVAEAAKEARRARLGLAAGGDKDGDDAMDG